MSELSPTGRRKRRPQVAVECEACNTPFRARQSHIERGKARFCSKKCAQSHWAKTEAERFHERVDRSAGPDCCWPWTGPPGPGGYGVYKFQGKNQKAHRVAWQLANGPVPDGLKVLHECDNPACCNATGGHLFLGTQDDNMKDMAAKGRGKGRDQGAHQAKKTHCPKGHPYDEENTIVTVTKSGGVGRTCRECGREAQRRYQEKKRRGEPVGVPKTHCPQGHPYDDMNTHWYDGRRYCRACHKERSNGCQT